MKDEHAEKLIQALVHRHQSDRELQERLLGICEELVRFLRSGSKEDG